MRRIARTVTLRNEKDIKSFFCEKDKLDYFSKNEKMDLMDVLKQFATTKSRVKWSIIAENGFFSWIRPLPDPLYEKSGSGI